MAEPIYPTWGRDGVDGHPCIRVESYVAMSDRLAAAIARAEAAEARVAVVHSIAWSANATAVLWGVVGTTPETYCGISKDDALDAAGDIVNDLRAALTTPTTDQPASAGGA